MAFTGKIGLSASYKHDLVDENLLDVILLQNFLFSSSFLLHNSFIDSMLKFCGRIEEDMQKICSS